MIESYGPSNITIGELRECLAADVRANLESIINAKQHEPPFVVLLIADCVENVIHSRFRLLPVEWLETMKQHVFAHKNTGFLNTVCWLVDTKQCKLVRVWCLPKDLVRPLELIDISTSFAEIIEEAVAAPIVH